MRAATRLAPPRLRRAAAATALAAGLVGAGATGLPPAARAAAPGEARADLLLPGRWLRGAVGGGAWFLTGTDADTPKQLFEVRWREGRARAVAALPAAVTRVVPMGAAGVIVTGSGGARRVDPATGAVRELALAGRLLDGSAVGRDDDVAPAPPWLVAAQLGAARRLRLAGGDLAAAGSEELPIDAERHGWGLELSTPPLGFAGPWLVVGPRNEGRRVRTLLLGPDGERREHLGTLPEPEQIADRAVVVVDGRPLLVLGTFRGLGLTTKKRLRVFALDGQAAPLVAQEIDAKVWNELRAHAADLDGDGRQELVVAAAVGFSEDAVRLWVFAGQGEGRVAGRPTTASFDAERSSWRYGDVSGDGRPDLVMLREGRLAVHAASGPQGLPSRRPTSTHAFGSGEPPRGRQVQVSVGGDGGRMEQSEAPAAADGRDLGEGEDAEETGADGWALLDLDGDGTLEAVRWEPAAEGRTRLTVVGRP